jgi:hypothetical protein
MLHHPLRLQHEIGDQVRGDCQEQGFFHGFPVYPGISSENGLRQPF